MMTAKRAIEKHGVRSILLVAPTNRTITRSLYPTLLSLYAPDDPDRPELKVNHIKFPKSGAEIITVSADAGVDSVRSYNVSLFLGDEICFFPDDEIITLGELCCRIPPAVSIFATTPKATGYLTDAVRRFEEGDESIHIVNGSTYENSDNLSGKFLDTLKKNYEGTRLAEIELEGKLILSNEDAMFQMVDIDANTIKQHEVPEIVHWSCGIDPSVLSKSGASQVNKKKGNRVDNTGIVLSGLGEDGIIYTFHDYTRSFKSHEDWAKLVAALYDEYSAQAKFSATAEVNALGLEMIQNTFRLIGRDDVGRKIKPTFSTVSKLQRAQPFALLLDQSKIKFVNERGNLDELHREMVSYDGLGKSPDRMDSWIFSMHELAPLKKRYTKSIEFLL